MHHDPITEEIRAIRHALAAKFDNDIHRIGEDIRQRELASGRKFVQLPKRPLRPMPRVNGEDTPPAAGS
jgi:hypothetical protein